jgi:rfaE bifunctional protein nucleotidyltransferase chain/domain
VALLAGNSAHQDRRRSPLKIEAAGARILTRDQAVQRAELLRRVGKRVVFTNGVFDLLHPGHVRYLEQARRLGDVLIVGVNADVSVRRNKGAGRPINPERERAEVLAALACVDGVVLFDEDTPAEIIRAVQPDVLVKGADWPADQIVGRDTVEARGGRVERVAVEQGHSTTAIIETIRTGCRRP